MSKKELLRKLVWNKKFHYYNQGLQTLDQFKQEYSYKLFRRLNLKPKSVLEYGCGNGRAIGRLQQCFPSIRRAVGFDISALAIKQAKKLFPAVEFVVGDAEHQDISGKFDIVCSFYIFEHLDNPEKVFKSMTQKVNKNGFLYIICPNYGSPIYFSPCFRDSLIYRFLKCLKRDILLLINLKMSSLLWEPVDPIIDPGEKHIYDHDTTIEPYIFSLRRWVEQRYPEFSIILATCAWEEVAKGKVSWKYWFFSQPFQLLSKLGIMPITYWGPSCILLLKRKTSS